MFVASRPIGLLDRYRVPYVVDPTTARGFVRIARADGATGAELLSFGGDSTGSARSYRLEGALLHASIVGDEALADRLGDTHGAWTEEAPIVDSHGVRRGGVMRAADGSVALPFDLDEPFDALLTEQYVPKVKRRAHELASHAYYRARPLLPYRAQMALRRRFRSLQERAVFPAWPTETSLHRLEALVLGLVERVAGEPLPWISAWPAPYTWAIVLTHDVERARGYGQIEKVLTVEQRLGLRSAWYFVPERDYTVEESMLNRVRDQGGEICLHGLRHDGRDLSPGIFQERLPLMRAYLDEWGARGFRGPATHRDRALVQELGIEHDSSWSDVARYEPQHGGTCSWYPFFIGDVVELPITLPMDHTLFELQRVRSPEPWISKSAFIRSHGGMVLMVTHPDYLVDVERLVIYECFLEAYAADPSVWYALPSEVASWWRRRANSEIALSNGAWTVVGPAAGEALVRVGAPAPPPTSTDS